MLVLVVTVVSQGGYRPPGFSFSVFTSIVILLYHVCFSDCVHWSMCNTRIDISRACLGCKHSYLCLYISKSVCRLINSKWNRLPFFIGCKHVMLLIYFRIFQQIYIYIYIYLFLSYFTFVNWTLALAIEVSVSGIPQQQCNQKIYLKLLRHLKSCREVCFLQWIRMRSMLNSVN